MATIKAYTDLEQSKKLAEILPLESADMIYIMYRNGEKPQNGDENLSTVYESDDHKWYWIDIIDESSMMVNINIIKKWIKESFLNVYIKVDYNLLRDNSSYNARMYRYKVGRLLLNDSRNKEAVENRKKDFSALFLSV